VMSVWILATMVLLASCSSGGPAAPPGISFPTYDAEGPHPGALLEGTLEVEDSCVYVARDGERWLGLWPNDLRAEFVEGRLRIVDGHGQVLATEGGPIRAAGGERRASELGGIAALDAWFAEIGGTTVPKGCGDLTWQVSGIETG
jgi:hypothetical protein